MNPETQLPVDRLAGQASVHRTAPAGPECRTVRRAEIQSALRMILGADGKLAADEHVIDFLRSAVTRQVDLNRIWVTAWPGRLGWAVLPLVNPGRSLLLVAPRVPRRAEDHTGAQQLIDAMMRAQPAHETTMAQVLIESNDAHSQATWSACGFESMAELLYLQASVRRVPDEPPLPDGMTWLTYSAALHDRFTETIARTYRQSLDCPALTGRRDVQDIIAGHKASGEFDPANWYLLTRGNQSLGVLLLSPAGDGELMEVVYLGLAPEARGLGLGNVLVRRALHATKDAELARLTLAVDSRNLPAMRLYQHHGMWQITTKRAMIRFAGDR